MSRTTAAKTLTARAEAMIEEGARPMRLRSVPLVPGEEAAIKEGTGAPVRVSTPAISAACERAIVKTLLRPIDPSDGHRVGNDRKEQELRALFAAMSVLEAMELHRRLRIERAEDAVAAAFARLVVERRQRLLAFLGDARRCAVLAAS